MVILSGCATINKCGKAQELENSVYDRTSCQVYIRQALYIDQVSTGTAEKIKQGDDVSLIWRPAKSDGSKFIPAHVETVPDNTGSAK